MCEYCLISGAVCFLVGFGLGRFLSWTKKEPKKEEPKDDDEYSITVNWIYG